MKDTLSLSLGGDDFSRFVITRPRLLLVLMEGGAQTDTGKPSLLDELGLVGDGEHGTDDPGMIEDIAFELEELGESDLESWEDDGEEIFVVPSECVEPLFRGFLRRALDVIDSLREPQVDPLLAFARLDQALGTLEKLSQSAEPMKLYREVAKKIPPIMPVPLLEFCINVHTGTDLTWKCLQCTTSPLVLGCLHSVEWNGGME